MRRGLNGAQRWNGWNDWNSYRFQALAFLYSITPILKPPKTHSQPFALRHRDRSLFHR
jgi:hypothetical protein